METTHEQYLDRLVSRLYEIREDPNRINWIIREGIWYKENHDLRTMPDIIACYFNRDFLVAELKGSINKREKARHQIESGVEFIVENFKHNNIYKKFVVYNRGKYYWEKL